jgi:creatinine amidohydrolase
MRLADLTTSEVAAGAPPVLAVPVGSCEQHGPHLPLGADTAIAEALADRLASRRHDVVVAPSLTVTASGEHAGFAGTLSIGLDATVAVIVELGRSADWSAGLVLVNGHGGNRAAVDAAVATLRADGRRVMSWWPPRLPAPHDAHAGYTETSLLLAIAPHMVRVERIEPGNVQPLADLASSLRSGGVAAVSSNGVLGDPRAATLEAGTELLEQLAADLDNATSAALASQWFLGTPP